ncbi:MAG: hypothetical protein GYB66_15610 [Chloroflexi bacterium]|nr:hypothetical protein [Chloroflexota bacterium]
MGFLNAENCITLSITCTPSAKHEEYFTMLDTDVWGTVHVIETTWVNR